MEKESLGVISFPKMINAEPLERGATNEHQPRPAFS